MKLRSLSLARMLVLLSFATLACSLGDVVALLGQAPKPNISIISPPSNSDFREGDTITVQSTATDAAGVVKVELRVDDAVVLTSTSPISKGLATYSLSQTWQAKAGGHVISVVAYNSAGVPSKPSGISVNVQAAHAPGAASMAALANSPLPTSLTLAPTSTCTDNAAFVSDVTVQDGSSFAPGQTFNKTWRVRNTGCPWVDGYQLVFRSGEAMTTTRVIAVRKTASGGTYDLSVQMTAPSTPGQHIGTWRLRNAKGALFGTAVTVKINVISPAAMPTRSPTRTACSGTPVISSFVVAPNQITAGGSATLSWGAVTNADSVEIDSIGGVATPGAVTVSPIATTAYTLTAHCGVDSATAQVTLYIPYSVMGAVTSANPTTFSGACPKTVSFSANIIVNGGGDVVFKWERSDSTSTQSRYINFSAAGTQTVYDSWTLGSSGNYWEHLHILSPTDVTTNNATFSLTCS